MAFGKSYLMSKKALEAFKLQNRRSELISRKRASVLSSPLSSKLSTWEVGFSLKPGESESQRLATRSRSMARAGLGGRVMGSYFLGCQLKAACPLPQSAGKREGKKISSMDPLFPRKLCVLICSSLPSLKTLFIYQKGSVQLEIEFFIICKMWIVLN